MPDPIVAHNETDSNVTLTATVAVSPGTSFASSTRTKIDLRRPSSKPPYRRMSLTLTNAGAVDLTNFKMLAASSVGGTHATIVDKDTTETWKFGAATLGAGETVTENVDIEGYQELSFLGVVGSSTAPCTLVLSFS